MDAATAEVRGESVALVEEVIVRARADHREATRQRVSDAVVVGVAVVDTLRGYFGHKK